jgi:hypothetical protein
MSVQLILYPQSYDGQYNSISTTSGEFVIDGINFSSINSASSYDSSIPPTGNVIDDTLTNANPSTVNTWYKFRSTSSGTPTLPTQTSNNLVLNSVTTLSISGVYQRLSNLTIGQQYTLTVNISTAAVGIAYIGAFNGSNNNSLGAGLYNSNQSQVTQTFTATTTSDIILVSFFNSANDNLIISNISVTQVGATPTQIYTELQDGQVICDLYEDEDIPLTLSVDDFKNVAEKVQSYSKAFNLPATKRNNQIFDSIFEVTRTDTGLNFNPYKKTQCILKQDGFILFEGYLRLIDIQDKEGEISYNVNLYSEVVALADVLKDRSFSDLDFTELTHDYEKQNIKRSWNDSPDTAMTYLNAGTSGFRDDYTTLRYPFIDWTHQIAVGGANDPAATSGNPELLRLEHAFRPTINIKYLIDRIFADSPFTYESEFFDTDDFKKLYMDFSWGSLDVPASTDMTDADCFYFYGTNTPTVGYNYATATYDVMELSADVSLIGAPTPTYYDDTTSIITSTQINELHTINYAYNIENIDTVDRDIECRWLYTSVSGGTIEYDYSQVISIPAGGIWSYVGVVAVPLPDIGDTLQVQFKTNSGTPDKVRQEPVAFFLTSPSGASVNFGIQIIAVTTATLLQTLRGELGQWEFLKGLMTMFNLVSLPDKDNPTNILIEPYNDVFIPTATAGITLANRGIKHDWTDKIDVSEMKLTPLTDLNKKTIFKFVEDDDDYAFMNYKNSVGGHLYGSKKQDEVFYTILDGEKEIVAEPFAATVPKPLMSQFSDFITPAIYSYNPDEQTSEGFDNSPRIMYNNGKKTLSSCTYFIPAQNGFSNENTDEFLQFSHLSDIPVVTSSPPLLTDTVDFHFGICQTLDPINIGSTPNNLYNMYWSPYYDELYNPDTRTMTIKVNLSPSDINTFNFYDTVLIKNREYRVNKIDYKPNDLATVEFILIP